MYKIETKYRDIEELLNNVDIASYSRTRSYLDGSVTHLSAYITHGVIDQVLVLDSLKCKYSWSVLKPFVFQMAWREYFYNIWEELGDEIFTDVRNVQMKVESYVLSRCMVNSSMLFELYDAFQQRQNVINKFLEFSDNTATLRNLSRNEIVHQINLLIKKRRI